MAKKISSRQRIKERQNQEEIEDQNETGNKDDETGDDGSGYGICQGDDGKGQCHSEGVTVDGPIHGREEERRLLTVRSGRPGLPAALRGPEQSVQDLSRDGPTRTRAGIVDPTSHADYRRVTKK